MLAYTDPLEDESLVRRVRFQEWTYLLVRRRSGHVLYFQEDYQQGLRPFAKLDGETIRTLDGRRLGSRSDLKPSDACVCRGCIPVGLDDGVRSRMPVTVEGTSAIIAPMRRRQRRVASAVTPGDEAEIEATDPVRPSQTPECRGCGLVKSLAMDGLCWLCLASR